MVPSRDEVKRRMDQFLALCRKRDFKATPQRLEVFRQVAQTDEHPEADVIFGRIRKGMPTISIDTVYRALAFLEENGLIRKVSILHGSARFDANVEKHHHFVCTRCGSIWDFRSGELDAFQPPADVTELGAVTSVHAELHGICRACQTAGDKGDAATGEDATNE